MKMFKKVVALILCLAFLLSFTACGDDNDGETTSPTESTTEKKQNDKRGLIFYPFTNNIIYF